MSDEIGAVTSISVPNRLAQTIGIDTDSYTIGNVSLYLRERLGESAEDFNVIVQLCDVNANGLPGTVVETTSKPVSSISYTGWHSFNFSPIDRTTPGSRRICFVMWQDGGDEDNYVSWFYGQGAVTGARALYSTNGGASWTEQSGCIRLIRVSRAYDPLSGTTDGSGEIRSSTATGATLDVGEFNSIVSTGTASHGGTGNGTTVAEDGSIVISVKKLMVGLVIDASGSMGWNDRGKNKAVAAKEIVRQVKENYPGEMLFDIVMVGSGGIGTPQVGGSKRYTTIKLDPAIPTSTVVNSDGSTPTVDDEIVAFGFSNLEQSHSYTIQTVKNGDATFVPGEGLFDPVLKVQIPDNMQSVGIASKPIRFSVQADGTGSETGADGSLATIAEVPAGGAQQIRRPTVTGRTLKTTGVTSDAFVGDATIYVDIASMFEVGDQVDFFDAVALSCGHTVMAISTAIGNESITVSPVLPVSIGAKDTSLGGIVQESSISKVAVIDQSSPVELLVKDAAATRKVTFFAQTQKGGRLEWKFFPLKEWEEEFTVYVDTPFNLVTYLTDEEGRALPPQTRVQYYIGSPPSWEDLPTTKQFDFDEPFTLVSGSDKIPMPSVSGISVGDLVTLMSSTGQLIDGYTVYEVDDEDSFIRIMPPSLEETFELVGVIIEQAPAIDKSDEKLSITMSAVDVSPSYAGRNGGGRLPSDPPQTSPSADRNSYNQDRTRWLHQSFEVPVIQDATRKTLAIAAVNIMPVTDDTVNTTSDDEEKMAALFDSSALTGEELAEMEAQEEEYNQIATDTPSEANEAPEEEVVNTSTIVVDDTTGVDYTLSPKESPLGEVTKFSSSTKTMSMRKDDVGALGFDLNDASSGMEYGLLGRSYLVYPAVRVKDAEENVTSRYVLPSFNVVFSSPIQVFCQPEVGKTVHFELCCFTSEGDTRDVSKDLPGFMAASGEVIRLDYVAYHRGKYLNDGSKMLVKIFDPFRSRFEIQSEPWTIVPDLAGELGGVPPGCQMDCSMVPSEGNFFYQTFNRRSKRIDGTYLDGTSETTMEEATYLDGYVAGGMEVPIVNGRASITIPATDVITRLVVTAEVVCPDNQVLSCVRYDNVWVKNPVELSVNIPSPQSSGFELQPFEATASMSYNGLPVEDNVKISMSGANHPKYNAGDSAKIDPNSDIGKKLQSLITATETLARNRGSYSLEAISILPQLRAQYEAVALKKNTWPPTPVKPGVGKTVNGVARGFMIGPHGPVTMHLTKAGDPIGDIETFSVSGSYKPPLARGPYPVTASPYVEWTGMDEEQESRVFKVTLWKDGVQVPNNTGAYADGWEKIMVVADIPASKNGAYPGFDSQFVIDYLLGNDRPSRKGRDVTFIPTGGSLYAPPEGRTTAFYRTKPISSSTGTPVGSDDQEGNVVGWAAVEVSRCAVVGERDPEAEGPCPWPDCEQILANCLIKTPEGKYESGSGCPADNVSGCIIPSPEGGETRLYPGITWINPLGVTFSFIKVAETGNPNEFDFIRDGKTLTEVWVDVTFSGRPLPLVAREHNITTSNGDPLPMPRARLDINYLDQQWNDEGILVKNVEFRDGTLTLTDYTPIVSVCRTSTVTAELPELGHYHSCQVDDDGNGETTGAYVEGTRDVYDLHSHSITDFIVAEAQNDAGGNVHTHQVKSVAITYINPISDEVLNICVSGEITYDASRIPTTRKAETKVCSQREKFDAWFLGLSLTPSSPVEPDVLVTNRGVQAVATLTHKVNGDFVNVDDGYRVLFNVEAYQPRKSKDEVEDEMGVPTFDVSGQATRPKKYALMEVTAMATVPGKTITKKGFIRYDSSLKWTPSVRALFDEPTADGIYLENGLKRAEEVMGSSAIYDGIVLAADRVNEWQIDHSEWGESDKAFFLLSDGDENVSERTINQIPRRVMAASRLGRQPMVGILSFGSASQTATTVLEKIRSSTNGEMVNVPLGCDPAEVPDKVSELMRGGWDSFNSGNYTGTVRAGGDGGNEDAGDTSGVSFRSVSFEMDVPVGGSASCSIRFSNDLNDWTTWTSPVDITGGSEVSLPPQPYRYMQYIIRMRGNEEFESPKLTKVSVSYLKPSRDTIFFQPIPVDAAFDEYVNEAMVSSNGETPELATVEYGIINNNTIAVSDYAGLAQPWFKPNRAGIVLTRFNEDTTTGDYKTFTAKNGRWPAEATVDVYVIGPQGGEGVKVGKESYSSNPSTGSVTMLSTLANGSRVFVDVITEPLMRMACRITNHTEEPVTISDCSVMFNKTKRVQRLTNGMISRHPIGDDLDESSSSSESSDSSSSSLSSLTSGG